MSSYNKTETLAYVSSPRLNIMARVSLAIGLGDGGDLIRRRGGDGGTSYGL